MNIPYHPLSLSVHGGFTEESHPFHCLQGTFLASPEFSAAGLGGFRLLEVESWISCRWSSKKKKKTSWPIGGFFQVVPRVDAIDEIAQGPGTSMNPVKVYQTINLVLTGQKS